MDSDNWVVQNLENALNTWNTKMAEVWSLLTMSPQSFKDGGIWHVILQINGAVKGIGLALDKPLIAVSTLEGLAMNAWGMRGLICPIMDARREQVYTGIYRFGEGTGTGIGDAGELVTVKEGCAIAVEELCGMLNDMPDEKVLFLGDGVPVYREAIDKTLRIPHSYAPAHMSGQRAGALAVLAARYYKEGRIETAAEHKPEYLRVSQAERVRAEQEKTSREAG